MLQKINYKCVLSSLLLFTTSLFAQTQIGADIDGEAGNDQSGKTTAISADGHTVAIGATSNGGNGINSGHVRVYKFISGTWTQQGADIDGEAIEDYSGWSLSLSADGLTVAIGSIYNDGNGDNSGHVRIYKLISGAWVQQGADIDGGAKEEQLGSGVSLSADGLIVAIAANGDGMLSPYNGYVRIYKIISDTWIQQGTDIIGKLGSDGTGNSVSISADGLTVATGSLHGEDSSYASGNVRIFKLISGTWKQQGADINGEAEFDESGISISLSADGFTVAIGAIKNSGNGTNGGHTRIYKLINNTWIQQGIDINGEADYDWSGWSVSLSADGLTVAIGTPLNDGNGENSGHVRIYKLISGTWVQQGVDIDGEVERDYSGYSVSLSADGLTVAIGAPYNDNNGPYKGHVRVYSISDKTNISTKNLNPNINVYPNPCNEILQIDIADNKIYTNALLTLTDIAGKTIFTQNTQTSTTINTAALANGIYMLNITTALGVKNIKLVKK